MKKIKCLFSLLIVLILVMSNTVFASDSEISIEDINENNRFVKELRETKNFDMDKTFVSYDPISKPIVLENGMENYINPVTREYFIIENTSSRSGDIAKEFSFDIRVSVRSSAFYVDSSRLSVYSKGRYYNNAGEWTEPRYGSTYNITIQQELVKKKTVSFPINSSQTSTFGSGWKTDGKKTYIEIINDGSFDRYDGYIVGSGEVYND